MAFWSGLFGKRAVDLDRPPVSIDRLRTQVFSTDYFGIKALDRGKAAIRPLAHGLVEAIVEDVGGGERTLNWDALNHFDKSREQLFETARTQAAAVEIKSNGIVTAQLDGPIEVMSSNGFYLSAYLLEIFARREPKQGVLFAAVSWHHWCVHVVQPMSVAPIVPLMELVVEQIQSKMKATDAERLTGYLYWYKPSGVIEKLDVVGQGATRRATSSELAATLGA